MTISRPHLSLSEVAIRINSGKTTDIDYFMSFLDSKSNIATIKVVDFALSQISSKEGMQRIKYYLFSGTKIQRSYAALYFKRHGYIDILREAVIQNCVDEKQAYSI